MISQETKTFYAFNIDKMFKAVFVGTDEVSKRLLLELLSECLDAKVDRIIDFIQSNWVLEVNMKEVKD